MPDTKDIKPVGELKPVTPAVNEVKPVGELKPLNDTQATDQAYYKAAGFIPDPNANIAERTNRIIDSVEGLDDGKKDILRDLAKNNASTEEISQAIGTLQGKHPHQDGVPKYYLNDRGVPVPLKNDERPPAGYNIASVWGTQKQADDDNPFTTITKHLVNVVPGLVENVADLAHLPYGLIAGEDADWYKAVKNQANYIKLSTSEASKKGFLDAHAIKEYGDILSSKNWDFNPDNVAGTVGQVAKSVGEYILAGKLLRGALGVTKASSAASKVAAAFTSSYMTQLGEVMDAGRDAGVDLKDNYKLSSAITIPLAITDLLLGVEGSILRNSLLGTEKKAIIQNLVRNIPRNEAGEITREGLEEAFQATVVANTSLARRAAQMGLQGGSEAAQETLQAFTEKAGQQLYDHLSDDNKKKYGTSAFNPEALADYVNEAMAGFIGGAGSSIAFNSEKAKKQKEQSETAFGLAQEGDEALNAYRRNILDSQKNGEISDQEAHDAITRINAYKEYNDIIGSMNLDSEKKREAFDKTFQKQNLESTLMALGDPEKLNPLKQAEYHGIVKQADDLQKDINSIVLEGMVREEPVVSEKTNQAIEKENEKREEQVTNIPKAKSKSKDLQKGLREKFPDKFRKETRTYDEVPAEEYNDSEFNDRDKHRITAEWLETQPDKSAFGTIAEREFDPKTGNTVLGIELPNGKIIRFASSMKRIYPDEEKTGGFRGHFMEERFKKDFATGTKVGMSVHDVTNEEGEVSKHIKGFRKDNGRFAGWVKLTHTGSYAADSSQENQFRDLEINPSNSKGTDQIEKQTPVVPKPTPQKPINKPAEKKQEKPKPTENRVPKKGEAYTDNNGTERVWGEDTESDKAYEIAKTFESIGDAAALAGARQTVKNFSQGVSYSKPAAIEAAQKNPFYNIEIQSDGSAKVIGVFDPDTKSWVGKPKDLDVSKNITNLESESKPDGKADKNTSNRKETTAASRSDREASKAGKQNIPNKEATLRTGKEKSRKDPVIQMALRHEVHLPLDIAIQHFIKGATLYPKGLKRLWSDYKTEVTKRNSYTSNSGKTIEQIATELHKGNPEYSLQEFKTAVEDVIKRFKSSKQMAVDLNKRVGKVNQEDFSAPEQEMSKAFESINNERIRVDTENVIDQLEDLSNEELTNLAEESQQEFDKWEDDNNIIKDDGTGPVFQKESLEDQEEIDKIIETIKKAFPKVEVIYDDTIEGAGLLDGKTIRIHPLYAGSDTPIHEAAHVFLDAMGENKVVQKAVEQLKTTALWKETKNKYKELDDKALANEVLAEAIGREGKDIFSDVADQSKFKQYLNYIFDWLKNRLGLEKNIAKSLARQIISGIGTKELSGKPGEIKEQRFDKREFNYFREKFQGRNVQDEKENLEAINDILEGEVSPEEKEEIRQVKKAIEKDIKQDREAYEQYRKEMDNLHKIEMAEDLKGFTLEELTQAYNSARFYSKDKEATEEARERIAAFIQNQRIEDLKKLDPEIEEKINSKDLSWAATWFKSLSVVTEKFPLLQGLSVEFEEKYLAKTQDANDKKRQLEKLGKAVIKEKNKALGIVSDLFTSDSAKYFEFVEEKGKLRTNTAGLTKAQKDYLAFMHDLLKERKILDQDGDIVDNELIKMDKNFQEVYRDEGLLAALNVYLGGNNNPDSKVTFENPITGKTETTSYLNAQKSVLEYAKKGNKAKAFGKLTALAYKAKRNGENKNYYINKNGALTSQFDQVRPEGKGYSKDFYRAAMAFIDDSTHVKYIGELVPVVDSIEQFYKKMGIEEGKDFKNTLKFIEEWKSEQIYHKQSVTDPIFDLTLNLLRNLTSKTVMAFAVRANAMNVIIGNYNAWRKEGLKHWAIGNKRMFWGDRKLDKDSSYGVVNKKAIDILRLYDVVNPDFDSNPKAHIGKLFDMIAFAGGRWGEVQIQGSQFLGYLTEDEWNSFQEDKNGNWVLKPSVDKKKFDRKMIEYKDNVSDIQGKYAAKDRKNFMRLEAGRNVGQFRVWIPEFIKERFGAEYIDKNNKVKRGSWNLLTKRAIQELRDDFKTKGPVKAIWENKAIMSNLKGAMTVAVLLIAMDDDKKKKKREALSLENALSNMFFVLDPEQAKYMLQSPSASIGTVVKFIDAFEGALKGDSKKFKKNAKKLIPYNKLADVPAEIEKITK